MAQAFDAGELMTVAQRKETLDDWGPLPFTEPLAVLADSYSAADLNDIGVHILRSGLIHSLRMRLRAQEWVRRHPEISAEKIVSPIVVVGMMRSGTTLLQRLLAADSRFHCAYGWEVVEVAPQLDYRFDTPEDPRIAISEKREATSRELAPELFSIHPMYAREPEEEIVFLSDAFLSHVPESGAHVPHYRSWIDGQDFAPAYAYLHRMLQFLQWQKRQTGRTAQRWVLKSPAHLGYLDTLRAQFPDLHVVHMHRDPKDTIASGASLNATLHAMHADNVDRHRVGAEWLQRMGWTNDRAMATRSAWTDEATRCTDIEFADAVADPIGQVARVYDAVGVPLTTEAEAAMRRWLVERPREPARPPYAPADFGLSYEQIDERFAIYNSRLRSGTTSLRRCWMSDFTGNPVATESQHEQELAALELTKHPTVKEAYRSVAETWLGRAKASEAMRERFDDAFAEVMFSAAVWSSNQDKLRPKVSCITRLGHPVAGHAIPGSRWGIDNPDSVYRVIPISGDERYEIRGQVGANRMTENYFTLWDANMGTVAVLNGRTMEVDSDGSFTITVDSEPAGGRPNHVQTTPQAHEFYIRDVLLNWDRDDPNHLAVQRLGAAPSTPPRTVDEQAEATAGMMAYFANFTGKLSHGVYKMAPNNFNLAWSADKVGAMRNQVYVMGRFDLNPGEAFVVDVSDGGAEYFTVPLSNIWGTTLDIIDRTGSLNKAQSEPNDDGTYTYVISPTDPGLANWIDSDGLREGILTLRMAEFGEDGPKEDLGARGRVVKLDDLEKEVSTLRRVSADERAIQLADRRAAYLRRLPEGTN